MHYADDLDSDEGISQSEDAVIEKAPEIVAKPASKETLKVPSFDDLSHLGHAKHKIRHHPVVKTLQALKTVSPEKRRTLKNYVPSNSASLLLKRYQGTLTSFFILFLVIFTMFRGVQAKDEYELLAKNAQTHLDTAFQMIDQGNLSGALKEADQAGDVVRQLKLLTQSLGQDVKYLSLLPSKSSRLVAYERFLDGAHLTLKALDAVNQDLGKAIKKEGFLLNSDNPDQIPAIDLAKLRSVLGDTLQQVEKDLTRSSAELALAKDALPENLRNQCDQAIAIVNKTRQSIKQTKAFVSEGLPWLSGEDGKPKKILILFQNNTELRGGGGFIGSFALARFEQGKLSKLDFETNIYKLDKAFSARKKVTPPIELIPMVGDSWAMRDSNFAVDFAESMGKVSEFYAEESGNVVDGIIALDTTLFINLLRVVGPIEMPEYGKTITDQNFLSDVQYEVEKGYFEDKSNWDKNEPKKILAVMMPRFINQLVGSFNDEKRMPEIIELMHNALVEKHLLLYFENPDLQLITDQLNLGGTIDHKLTDYLFVHNTNIGGMKSSLNVEESLKHSVVISQDGLIKSELVLNRSHRGSGVWPDGDNNNLVRILLPQGSKVTGFTNQAGNFWPMSKKEYAGNEVYTLGEEAAKTKVTFWQNTKPKEGSKSVIAYTPNYKVDMSGDEFVYRIFVQKQAGSTGDEYELAITYPAGYRPVNVRNYDSINRQVVIRQFIRQDSEFLIRFEKVAKHQ